MMTYVLIIAGFALLFIGGEALVRGSVSIARTFGISELIIGLTLVGFGTSVPELVTSLRAIETDAVGIAVGNVVGSNVANVLLVLGVAALLSPIITNPKALTRDTVFMILVTVVFCALIWFDMFTRNVGIGLVSVLVVYLIFSIVFDRSSGNETGALHADEAATVETHDPIIIAIPMALFGVAAVIFGARYLVTGGVDIARDFGVSETLVGLTVVAIGTSLPELATSAVSALRGKSDVALGNIIGSNIFNILGIMGITAIVHPFSVLAPQTAARGYGYGEARPEAQSEVLLPLISSEHIGALVLSVFLLLIFAFTSRKIARWEGAVMLGAYALYIYMSVEGSVAPAITPG
ncbi:MAG: calcium/sodium antiporter [Pseudomonadota bacterium]